MSEEAATDVAKAPSLHENGEILTALTTTLRSFGSLPLEGGALAQAAFFRTNTKSKNISGWNETSLLVCLSTIRSNTFSTAGMDAGQSTRWKRRCATNQGPGDMLALFRCLSCKYSFSANLNHMTALGAPGRVFLSGEAETSDNVQQHNVSIYLRVKDAQACRVSSTVLLPVFADASRKQAVAVLEVTQFDTSGASYKRVFDWARYHLEGAGLYTPMQLETRTFEMQSHALSIRFFSSRDSALGCVFSDNGSAGAALCKNPKADLSSAARKEPGNVQAAIDQSPPIQEGQARVSDDRCSSENRNSSAGDSEEAGDAEGSTKGGIQQPQPEPMIADEIEPHQPNFVGESPSQGQSKAALTRQDLEKHFGYGLKEAAVRLGVCNTTLKRACRRHGIMKWPRRELLKNAKLSKDASLKAHPQAHASSQAEKTSALNIQPQSTHAQQFAFHPARLPDPGRSHHLQIPALQQQKDVKMSQATALHNVGSSNYLAGAAVLPLQQRAGIAELPTSQAGMLDGPVAGRSMPRSQDLHALRCQWQGSPPAGTAVNASETTAAARGADLPLGLTEAAGSQRGSLGFDSLFGEVDGAELGPVLDDWERQVNSFKSSEEPQAMEVVSQAVHKDFGAPAQSEAGKAGFPDIPEPWTVDQGSPGAWRF